MAVSRIIEKFAEFNRDESGWVTSSMPAIWLAASLVLAAMLGGCTGYQPAMPPVHYAAPRITGPAPPCVQIGDHFECLTPSQGSDTASISPGVQVATASPVPPVARPVRSASIEYVDGQPMVRISVPGVANFRCLLDTGASDLVFPGWWLLDMHDHYGLANSDWSVIGTGAAEIANGQQIKTYHLKFREIHIGSWRLTNVPVTVTSPGSICLLGMSVLKVFGHPMIDFANQRLILED